MKSELLMGHSTLSSSELSGQQHSANEFSLKLVATEQAAQQTIQSKQREAVFFRQQAETDMQSMLNRTALRGQMARYSMQDATTCRTTIGQYHAELSALRVQLATAEANATGVFNMAVSADGGTAAHTQIVRGLRAQAAQLQE